jgi:hypothetical protein
MHVAKLPWIIRHIPGGSLVRALRSLSLHRSLERRSVEMEYLQTLRLEYEDYLRSQRGLSEKSVYDCWRFADRFLEFRFNGKRSYLSKIAPVDIARFMQHLISRGKPFRDKTPPTHLRNFFQFLFKSGRTNVNLAPSAHRAEIRVQASEAPNAGAGGNSDRGRQGGYGAWAAQLCHGASDGAARAARGGSHRDPD